LKRLLIVAVFALAASACGEEQGSTSGQEQATRELREAQKDLRTERRKLRAEGRKRRKKESSGGSNDSGGSAGGNGSGEGVPDVEGKDHQLAQDTMQAAGFYNISEEDATGQDRLLINDRGWTVESQSPKAGTRASPDRTIVLRSRKDGE
jgi:hypothetical protein